MRKGSLYKIKSNNAVFSSAESDVEYIHLVPIFHIGVVYFLYRVLHELFKQIMVFLYHCRDIYKAQRSAIWLRLFQHDKFRSSIERSTLGFSHQPSAIEVAIGLCPHIWIAIISIILPVLIESQNIQFFIIHRTWLFAELQWGAIQQQTSRL